MDIAYFAHITLLSGLAVMVVQQILKLKFIPVAFANRYPVPTNLLLSTIASIIVTWKTVVQPDVWQDWAVLIGTIALVAAVTYNALLRNWSELRATEGEK